MPRCELCSETLDDDQKVFGRHLWEQHRVTPNDYRTKHLGLPPRCKRPGCRESVPRDAAGRWFTCCSPDCALEMGEDIPVGPRSPSSWPASPPPAPPAPLTEQEIHDRGEVIMSARVCGTLLLLPALYMLVTGAEVEWSWGLLLPLAGLAMVVFGFGSTLPKLPKT